MTGPHRTRWTGRGRRDGDEGGNESGDEGGNEGGNGDRDEGGNEDWDANRDDGIGAGGSRRARLQRREDRSRVRRRMVLDVLDRRAGWIDVRDLAAGLLAREGGSDEVDDDALDGFEILLHHVHLPELDERGLVDYDVETNQVHATPVHTADALAPERRRRSTDADDTSRDARGRGH